MSLQVWLPLNGDLHNQGLSNIVLSGSPTWGTGKIGSKSFCCNTGMAEVTINELVNVTEFSIAYWLYIDSSITDFTNYAYFWELQAVSGNTTTVIRDELRTNTANLGRHALHMIKDASVGSNTNTYYGLGERDDAKNKWCHVVITKDTNYCDAYADGVRYAHAACSNFENSPAKLNGKFWLGMGGCKSAYLNDFRIYDHCLSQMEVKELAKGLVLHYPLNRGGWGQENLWQNGSCQENLDGMAQSTVKFTITTKDGYKCAHLSGVKGSSNAIGHLRIPDTMLPEANDWYTISADMRIDNYSAGSTNPYVGIYFGGDYLNTDNTGGWYGGSSYSGDGKADAGTFVNTYNNKGWHRVTCTVQYLHGGSEYKKGAFYLGYIYARDFTGDLYVKNIKLERGKIATSWCPNIADSNNMGLNNSTIEYDCSGYGYNGVRTGTFTWSSDTPKYNVSTHIGSTTTKIHVTNLITSGFGNSYSFAWWGKRSSNGPMFWGFEDGIRLNGMYQGNLWNTGDGSENPIYKPGTTTSITVPSLGVWHHYVMTGNGTVCKLYLDGVLYGQAKTYKAISGTSLWINGWNSATTYCSDNTDISDFRIYATALSADDVKSLYQNSAYIDSSGNVYGAIHMEA